MATDLKKVIESIRISVKKDSTLLPDFIDNQKVDNRMCQEIATDVIMKFLILFNMSVLKPHQIKNLNTDITIMIDDMILINSSIAICYFEWFKKLLEAYKELCLEEELYEAVTNINNFLIEIEKYN